MNPETVIVESGATVESDAPAFPIVSGRRARGYDREAVDAFLARAKDAFEGDADQTLTAEDIRVAAFPLVREGYEVAVVDAALTRVEEAFAQRAREDAIGRAGSAEWVARARRDAQEILDRLSRPPRQRFARAGWLRYGYRIDEVDMVSDRIRGFFTHGAPVTVEQVRSVAFRMQWRGYREAQVDAVLDAVVEVMLAVR